ncbi:hypothetical protein [Novosphingobium malaysiense]|uniref:hypothetical protein n=1 Tax=Novosphingobium malaysiense TaxID=1348853 RepID=UPI0012E011B7|nr:hypothetical protein [Novosphingobium malaysiense]
MAIKPSKRGQAWAWRFHFGIREIERAYKASRDASDKEVSGINEAAARHQAKVDAGEATWSEEDEDGNLVYDYGERLGEQMYDVEQVLALIRNAFVITLHHFVEQRVGAQLPKKKYDQTKGFSWLKGFGWTPMEGGLNQLRLAANCAKHSEGASASQLYALRPDMFDEDMVKGWGAAPAYDTLKLTDAHVDEFFAAVQASVPKMGPAL